jgi:hypothetical protein
MTSESSLGSIPSVGLVLLETTPTQVLISDLLQCHGLLSSCPDNDAADACAWNRTDIVGISKDCHPASGVEI